MSNRALWFLKLKTDPEQSGGLLRLILRDPLPQSNCFLLPLSLLSARRFPQPGFDQITFWVRVGNLLLDMPDPPHKPKPDG